MAALDNTKSFSSQVSDFLNKITAEMSGCVCGEKHAGTKPDADGKFSWYPQGSPGEGMCHAIPMTQVPAELIPDNWSKFYITLEEYPLAEGRRIEAADLVSVLYTRG